MKIVADESVDGQIVARLRPLNHEVVYIAETEPGISDDAVLQSSRESGAFLLTADKDFGDLVFRQQLLHSGILLIRLAGLTPEEKARAVAAAVDSHGSEFAGQFAVLSKRALRLRRMSLQP